jgi:thymidylate synthase
MNNLDTTYTDLLSDILDNGVVKGDRTGTGTTSVFGRQIRHNMAEGFPLLTTKKMAYKSIIVELLWFLKGDTNIQYLVKNNCNIWNGDAYKKFKTTIESQITDDNRDELYAKGYLQVRGKNDVTGGGYKFRVLSQEEFVERIKLDDEFAKEWGDLGPIYGWGWRNWNGKNDDELYNDYLKKFNDL